MNGAKGNEGKILIMFLILKERARISAIKIIIIIIGGKLEDNKEEYEKQAERKRRVLDSR